jgi:hypothetical protein
MISEAIKEIVKNSPLWFLILEGKARRFEKNYRKLRDGYHRFLAAFLSGGNLMISYTQYEKQKTID